MRVAIKRLAHGRELPLPAYATEGAAGMDLLAANTSEIVLAPGAIEVVPTGISLALPRNWEAQVRPRSGLALKFGLTVLNSPGTIDCDYRGEVKVILINHGKEAFTVSRGLKVAQLVIAAHARVEWEESSDLESTTRADGGFGSTGLRI
ncbi:MAG: dUTP diphosphatase [Micropepsaceae bacterium]